MNWTVGQRVGTAEELHRFEPSTGARAVWRMEFSDRALILGSAQRDETLDSRAVRAAGIAVSKRRTGGGAVLLLPGQMTWVDVVIPRDDVLWDDDVTRSFAWLGNVWARSVVRSGLVPPGATVTVHSGESQHANLGRIVCFAGLGSGEVLVDDRKLIGMSQRRTRDGARFQCSIHETFVASDTFDLLSAESKSDALWSRLTSGVATVSDARLVVDEFLKELNELHA